MKMIKPLLSLLIFIFYFIGCSQQQSKMKKESKKESSIEIIVERGAFHYDKFVLKDSIVTFYPEKEIEVNSNSKNDEQKKYYQKSQQQISKKQLKNILLQLEENDIWKLKDIYKCNSSCTSSLKVILKIDGKEKTIKCQDFKRDCPQIIQYIENQLIELHSKNLKRVMLPG